MARFLSELQATGRNILTAEFTLSSGPVLFNNSIDIGISRSARGETLLGGRRDRLQFLRWRPSTSKQPMIFRDESF